MNITLHRPQDSPELDAAITATRDANQRDRLRVLRLALDGWTCPNIQEATGRSKKFVQQWCYTYRDHGLQAVRPKPKPGRAPLLDAGQQEAFKKRILDGPTKADGVCTLRGRDAQRILADEFDAHFGSLQGVYALLHRLGLSCLRPRPQHTNNDPSAMNQWLEDAPFLSNVSARRTGIARSRSGSRTNPGSASKAR